MLEFGISGWNRMLQPFIESANTLSDQIKFLQLLSKPAS